MVRLARLVVPGLPHHVTQRGNRRQPVFFGNADKRLYLRIVKEQAERFGVQFWAYCLMDNHVHFIAVPEEEYSLARGLGEAHRRYTHIVNAREGWSGYLWQGRFASFPLAEKHLYAAIRYVERNPVEAKIVSRAEDYPWSSARAHVTGQKDPLLCAHFLSEQIKDWSDFLLGDQCDTMTQAFDQHSKTGRPLGDSSFLAKLEQQTGRVLQKKKTGRPPQDLGTQY